MVPFARRHTDEFLYIYLRNFHTVRRRLRIFHAKSKRTGVVKNATRDSRARTIFNSSDANIRMGT